MVTLTARFSSAGVFRAGENLFNPRRRRPNPIRARPRGAHRQGAGAGQAAPKPLKDGGSCRNSLTQPFFDLACRARWVKGLHSPTLTLLQLRLDRLQSVDLARLLDSGDLANHPVESGLVQLSLRIGLLGLRLRTVKVSHDFSDRVDIAGVDFGFVLLSPPRPHCAFDARASGQNLQRAPCGVGIGYLAHSNA